MMRSDYINEREEQKQIQGASTGMRIERGGDRVGGMGPGNLLMECSREIVKYTHTHTHTHAHTQMAVSMTSVHKYTETTDLMILEASISLNFSDWHHHHTHTHTRNQPTIPMHGSFVVQWQSNE